MKRINRTTALSAILLFVTFSVWAQTAIPNEWIDKFTGHKVIRLTQREGNNASFYFHNNPFIKSADGKSDEMIFVGSTENGRMIFKVNLSTLSISQITTDSASSKSEIIARKHREIIYNHRDSIMATHLDTHKTRLICVLPPSLKARVATLNANETLLAGGYSEQDSASSILKRYPAKHDFFQRIYNAKIPHTLFTVNIETGEFKIIHQENTWLGHIQFSPTDPDLLMFCHEGPWDKVDRIWTKNINTGELRLMHKRTIVQEIAGHEFWSPDGNTIWFDWQNPRSVHFNLAGVDVKSGKMVKAYLHNRNEWSIHYNISPDMTLFCGDGGDSSQVAKAKDGQWIYLFRPDGDRFKAERLVNMQKHGYKLEPNVHFSPDGKWIIFRSNMFGAENVYAVEL